jgi:ABC-type xylose transport system permease subunit
MNALSNITPLQVAMLLLVFWISLSIGSLGAFSGGIIARPRVNAMVLICGSLIVALVTLGLLIWAGLRA